MADVIVPSGLIRPENPVQGQLFFDTGFGVLLVYTGQGWKSVDGTPIPRQQ